MKHYFEYVNSLTMGDLGIYYMAVGCIFLMFLSLTNMVNVKKQAAQESKKDDQYLFLVLISYALYSFTLFVFFSTMLATIYNLMY